MQGERINADEGGNDYGGHSVRHFFGADRAPALNTGNRRS